MRTALKKAFTFAALAVAMVIALLVPAGATMAAKPADKPFTGPDDNAIFFASDGIRQDLVAKYAAQGVMPTMAGLLVRAAEWMATSLRSLLRMIATGDR